jgi:uncharacterized membrane protein
MERIQQAFDNLKERLNNPLVFSFIISWIFLNWKVTVALLWHDSSNDDNSHIKLINFIVENTSIYNSIVLPLGYAILYTFLSPHSSSFATRTHVISICDASPNQHHLACAFLYNQPSATCKREKHEVNL